MVVESMIAWLGYRYNIFPLLLTFVPFIFNLVLLGLAVGIAGTGLIFRYRFEVLAWGFAGLQMPFSCVFYPLKSFPEFLHPVKWILPGNEANDRRRGVLDPGVRMGSGAKPGLFCAGGSVLPLDVRIGPLARLLVKTE